ncbi:MAG TPA: transglycosylase domain-containing protein, partial [Kiritimatiellia bacterium]
PFHRIRIEVKGTVDPAREVFTVQDGVLQIRGLSIPFSYARTLGSQPSREDFTARLDDATGPQLTASLPLVALPRLGMPKLDGTLSLSIIGHIDNERPEAAEVTARVRNRLIVNGLPEQFDTASLQKKFRIDVYDAAGGSKRYDLGPAMPDWVSATSAPPHLAAAILAAIDPLFGEHRGVSDLALSAVLTDLVKQRRRYGGYDTISQRVAATLWPMDRRDAVRNIELGLLATHLESNLGKDEILDLFLNIAPWNGGDYFGVRTACRMFFDKDLAELAPEESAFIAVALTAPDGSIMGERGIPKPDAIADAVDVLRALNRSELLPDESLRSAVKTLSEVGWPLRAVRSRDDETAPRAGRRRPQ